MKRLFVLATLLSFTALAMPAHAERVILKNPGNAASIHLHAIRSFTLGADTFVVVDLPRFSPLMADAALTAESVTPDLRIELPALRSGANDDSSGGDTDATKAWHVKSLGYDSLPAERDGRGVTVAVLDTGVDYTHQALKDHIWTNAGEIPGNGLDDDGNGFIDDVHGFDFESDDADPMDGDAHGTHCAGIIGASADPASGARGVAPGVRIMAVRIIGSEQAGFLSDAVAGIQYAVDNGARVLSNSWRVYRSWDNYNPSEQNVELLRKAIEYAHAKGAIFVAAAGNESVNLDSDEAADPIYPAGYQNLPGLLVVASSDTRNAMSYFSNYGANYVNVAAPGSDIISTTPGNQWESFSGTSMATPLVAGAIARGLSGAMGPAEAMEKISATSTLGEAWTGKVKSGGIVNLRRFLAP